MPKDTQNAWYVKLAAQADRDAHKRPVEPDWPNLRRTLAEALAWIEGGFGVGLNLAQAPGIAVVDVDTDTIAARQAVELAGKAGALVCRSLSGWHIFYAHARGELSQKGARLRVQGVELDGVEWYAHTARQIVLPAAGTPRAELGGYVAYMGGIKVGRPVALSELHEALEALPPLDVVPIAVAALPTTPTEASGAIVQTFGKPYYALSKPEVLDTLRRAKEGERNNTTFLAAVLYGYWGADLRELELEAARLFGPNDYESRGGLWKTIQSGAEFGAQLRAKAPEAKAAQKPEPPPMLPPYDRALAQALLDALPNEKQPKAVTILMALAKLKEAGFPAYALKNAVAVGSYVVREGQLGGFLEYLTGGAISLGKEREDKLFGEAESFLPFVERLTLVSAWPVPYDTAALIRMHGNEAGGGMLAIVDWVKGIFRLLPIGWEPLPEGVFVEWRPRLRRFMDAAQAEADLADLRERGLEASCVQHVLSTLEGFLLDGEPEAKRAAVVGMIAATLRQGLLLLEGDSGSGKTALANALGQLKQGRHLAINPMPVREFDQIMGMLSHVLFDEVKNLGRELENAVKQAISGQRQVHRKLFTDEEIVELDTTASFVVCGTSISKLQQDTIRRALWMRLRLPDPGARRRIPESQMQRLLESWGRQWSVAAAALLAAMHDYRGGAQVPLDVLSDTKADIALGYWLLCMRLGIRTEWAARVWKRMRRGAMGKGEGFWDVALEAVQSHKERLERIQGGGVSYKELAGWVLEYLGEPATKEARRAKQRALADSRAAAAGTLGGLGIILEDVELRDPKTRGRLAGVRMRFTGNVEGLCTLTESGLAYQLGLGPAPMPNAQTEAATLQANGTADSHGQAAEAATEPKPGPKPEPTATEAATEAATGPVPSASPAPTPTPTPVPPAATESANLMQSNTERPKPVAWAPLPTEPRALSEWAYQLAYTSWRPWPSAWLLPTAVQLAERLKTHGATPYDRERRPEALWDTIRQNCRNPIGGIWYAWDGEFFAIDASGVRHLGKDWRPEGWTEAQEQEYQAFVRQNEGP